MLSAASQRSVIHLYSTYLSVTALASDEVLNNFLDFVPPSHYWQTQNKHA
jgi:hypothetical protein